MYVLCFVLSSPIVSHPQNNSYSVSPRRFLVVRTIVNNTKKEIPVDSSI